MLKAIGFLIVIVIAGAVCMHLVGRAERPAHQASPAFKAMLSQAVDKLEGVPQQITATTVPEAQAEPQVPTVDEYTCSGFRTCDALPTCDGSAHTCDGEITCDYSTCTGSLTCVETCFNITIEGGETCDGSTTCAEGCAGWPTYDGFNPTCVGGPTCEITCPGFVACSGCPSATERTTWGEVKVRFTD
jgi:hypothetical protein